MSMSSLPPDEYMRRSAPDRLRSWKWWYIVLLVLALAAGVLVIWRELHTATASPSHTSMSFFAAPLYAEAARDSVVRQVGPAGADGLQPYVMVGILLLIAVITLVCLGASLFSKNDKSVNTASDILKTCIGFFIGVATSYFGGAH